MLDKTTLHKHMHKLNKTVRLVVLSGVVCFSWFKH